jgi:hypothetical protein
VAAAWEGGSRVEDRAGEAGRCQLPAADDTELAVDPNWSVGHHLALEHGDGVDDSLLGQSLGRSSGVNGLQHFGLPRLLLGSLPVLLLLLGHDPPTALRFCRPSLRCHFLLAPWKDRRSGGGGLGGGLGDLIYGRALNGGGRAAAVASISMVYVLGGSGASVEREGKK